MSSQIGESIWRFNNKRKDILETKIFTEDNLVVKLYHRFSGFFKTHKQHRGELLSSG